MEQNLKLHRPPSIWPKNVIIVIPNHMDEHKIIHSQEEMDKLLEEVKLYNSENDDKKRIISI